MPWVTFHVLRHTRAAMWAQGGCSATKASFWLGHALEVHLLYYAGLVQAYDPDADLAA